MLLTGVVMISIRRKESLTIAEKKWFLYVGLAIMLFFFRNGGLKDCESNNMLPFR